MHVSLAMTMDTMQIPIEVEHGNDIIN